MREPGGFCRASDDGWKANALIGREKFRTNGSVRLERRKGRAEEDAIRARIALLTPREHEVMQRVARGQANKVIAMDLGVSQRTVELHRARVMRKLKMRSVAELVHAIDRIGGVAAVSGTASTQ